jgi:hypothetical protein
MQENKEITGVITSPVTNESSPSGGLSFYISAKEGLCFCVSSVGYKGLVPKTEDTVLLVGHLERRITTSPASQEDVFCFHSLEVLPGRA